MYCCELLQAMVMEYIMQKIDSLQYEFYICEDSAQHGKLHHWLLGAAQGHSCEQHRMCQNIWVFGSSQIQWVLAVPIPECSGPSVCHNISGTKYFQLYFTFVSLKRQICTIQVDSIYKGTTRCKHLRQTTQPALELGMATVLMVHNLPAKAQNQHKATQWYRE